MAAKRVWVLGAGFSAPLGGPLLSDLFSMRLWRQVRRYFPDAMGRPDSHTPQNVATWLVYVLFHFGRGFPDRTLFGAAVNSPGEQLFRDAEDFLVQLDRLSTEEIRELAVRAIRAVPNGPLELDVLRRNFVGAQGVHVAKEVVQMARGTMARECSSFHVDLLKLGVQEPCIPFESWGKVLRPEEDVLISFNYDLVVEGTVRPPAGVPLFKLHGSVTECEILAPDASSEGLYAALEGQAFEPAIRVPGREKAEPGTLQDRWAQANGHLRTADKIIFLGYGLPESDAYARRFLLQALRGNKRQYLKIDIVLGEPGFRRTRIESTIRQVLANRVSVDCQSAIHRTDEVPTYTVRALDQYAQDYLQGFSDSGERLVEELCRGPDGRVQPQLPYYYGGLP